MSNDNKVDRSHLNRTYVDGVHCKKSYVCPIIDAEHIRLILTDQKLLDVMIHRFHCASLTAHVAFCFLEREIPAC